MFVGTYDNGTGYMEWAGLPVPTKEEAQAQIAAIEWAATAVLEVQWDKNLERWRRVV